LCRHVDTKSSRHSFQGGVCKKMDWIVKSSCLFAVCGVGVEESCTVKVRVRVPSVVNAGIPAISPVAGFRLRLFGRGGVTDHVKGAAPPDRCNVVL